MRATLLTLCLIAVAFAGCAAPGAAPGAEPVPEPSEPYEGPVDDPNDPFALMEDFSDPIFVTNAGDGSGRLFVVEQRGTIVQVDKDGVRSIFADLRHRTDSGSEQGLLGLAFHPDFATNEVVIASYTDQNGDSVIERFRLDEDGIVDPNTGEYVLTRKQPYDNHNGGHILYGPDGYLYIGLGDGGSAGDPKDNGQNPKNIMGAILRIDVGPTGTYTIPADNPYADSRFGAPEVWMWGLRNPWRFSFDPNGALWIGDVGQGSREEINRVTAADAGSSLGWNLYEGTKEYPSGADWDGEFDKDEEEHIFPVAEYSDIGGHCSVTGGEAIGDRYYYGDYCSGTIWSMPLDGERGSAEKLRDTPYQISSFGRDEDGNVYIVDIGGIIERFSP
jgi:glucose/arabinose dehydrogenase